jgi:sialate O-acetylesterase
MRRASGVLSVALVIAAATVRADVRLPRVISDHMVLQRDRVVRVWGWSDAGEAVRVRFRGQEAATAGDRDGRWQVMLPASAAGGPFELVVAGKNTITVADVLVGDVWVGSGQSNMERAMTLVADSEREIAQANDPRIRLFTVPHKVADASLDDVPPEVAWTATAPDSIKTFSAVSYFFARELRRVRDVPIGLVHASWGGTPAEAWVPAESLRADAAFQPLLWQWTRMVSDYPAAKTRYDRQRAEWDELSALAKAQGKDPKNPPTVPRGPGNSWTPGGLYAGMIAPVTPFTIRGVLWYQGESNAAPYRSSTEYRRLFAALIQTWRESWNQGAFPFLFVQLANYLPRHDAPSESAWAELREAQAAALALPNTAMAVTIDIGEADDIHPKNKQDVGKRLALAARALSYGERVVYSGPVADGFAFDGPRLRVRFRQVGGGLVAKGDKLQGFALAGRDRRFVWADARIDGDSVIVSSPDVVDPIAVRYAWADNPIATLYNRDGLPAAPFRSDDWPYRFESP